MGHPLHFPPTSRASQAPVLNIASCVLVPIQWFKHGVELLQEHGESGPTVQNLIQRAQEWERYRAPGCREVKLSEQRAEFEKAYSVPDSVFWSSVDRAYAPVRSCAEHEKEALHVSALYAGFLLRARTPEGL